MIHFLLIIPALLLLYTNCDSFKSSESSQASLNNCKPTASLALKAMAFDPQTDCNNTELIHCERRHFRPDVISGEQTGEDCLSDTPYGNLCVSVVDRNYNTSGAEGEPQEFEEGGSYNYSEVNCYMVRFSQSGIPIFQSSTDSLESSLIALHKQCEQGGER